MLKLHPYPELVYTGWRSVYWNATGRPSVHSDTSGWHRWILTGHTGTPLEKLSWTCPTLECHWRIFVNCNLHRITKKNTWICATLKSHWRKLWLLQLTLEHNWRDYKKPHWSETGKPYIKITYTWSILKKLPTIITNSTQVSNTIFWK